MRNGIELKLNAFTILLGLNIVMFVISMALGSFNGSGLYTLLLLGAENNELVLSGQVWRMITSAFLHAGVIHIFANMYYFFQLGRFIEEHFGSKKLFAVYILTAITASALSVLAGEVGIQPAAISVGASGAVFGLLGLVFVSSWRSERNPFHVGLPLDYRQLIPYLIFSLILGVVTPGINNAAHIGGFIGGAILGFILRPEYGYSSLKKDLIGDILFYVSLGAFVLSFGALIIFNFDSLSLWSFSF